MYGRDSSSENDVDARNPLLLSLFSTLFGNNHHPKSGNEGQGNLSAQAAKCYSTALASGCC